MYIYIYIIVFRISLFVVVQSYVADNPRFMKDDLSPSEHAHDSFWEGPLASGWICAEREFDETGCSETYVGGDFL